MNRNLSCRMNDSERDRRRTTGDRAAANDRSRDCDCDCDCDGPDVVEPRYDSEELRDAARKLGPFIRLIEDANNPYARIIAREVCKTFYHLFHPNVHPVDAIRSVNWNDRSQRTEQLWSEFWLYVQGSRVKDWEPLCAPSEAGELNYNGLQPVNLMDVFDADQDRVRADPVLRPQVLYPKHDHRARSPNACKRAEKQRSSSDCGENACGYQRAGSDSLACCRTSSSSSPVRERSRGRSAYADESDDGKRRREKLAESESNRRPAFGDGVGKNRTTEQRVRSELATKRRSAGYGSNGNGLRPVTDAPVRYPQYKNARCPRNVCKYMEKNRTSDHDGNARGHQRAGSDSLACTGGGSEPNGRRPITNDRCAYADELDGEWIRDQIIDSKCRWEKLAETESDQRRYTFGDDIGKNGTADVQDSVLATKRHSAGYDTAPNCDPGPSGETADPYEYYRLTGNTSSPQQAQNYIFRPISNPPSPIYPEEPSDDAATADDECASPRDSSAEDGAEVERPDEGEIAYNASLVANAFTSLSIAAQDLRKKKEAFKVLTQNYLSLISSQENRESRSSINCSNAQRVMDTISGNQPKAGRTFIDHELNANAFKDRDFVRLLPFFESVHNKLEYIFREQRDYGINMLDDIMSTLYHIHYDLGDPRLKSDILAEHVKLITRNTWELYFYNETNRMPDIPEHPMYAQSSQRILSTIPELPEPLPLDSPQNATCRSYQHPSTAQGSSAVPYQQQQQPVCDQLPTQSSSAVPYTLPLCNPSTSQGSAAAPYQLPPCNPSTSQGSAAAPYQLPPCSYPSTSQSTVQQSNPNTSLRPPELRLPNPRPPSIKQSKQGPANVNRKVQAPSKRREADVPEPIATDVPEPAQMNKCKFLRRSRPSGAPKGWAPTVKPVERPENFKEFRAKPLPKFVRQRLCSRNEER